MSPWMSEVIIAVTRARTKPAPARARRTGPACVARWAEVALEPGLAGKERSRIIAACDPGCGRRGRHAISGAKLACESVPARVRRRQHSCLLDGHGHAD